MKRPTRWTVGLVLAFGAGAAAIAEPPTPAPSAQPPAAAAKPHLRTPRAAAPAKAAPGAKKSDFLALGTTTVTGNKELPKVMYIVPWKKSDLDDLSGRPVNSLLDEVLAPVDRDVFRREVSYYKALTSAPQQPGAGAAGSTP